MTTETAAFRAWKIQAIYDFNTEDRFPVQVGGTRYAAFTKPEAGWIQCDDPEIARLANDITSGCVWESDAVERVQEWMVGNIQYDWTFSGAQDARSVLTRRTGTCTGYSALAVALCRASGIPAVLYGGAVTEGSFAVSGGGSGFGAGWPSGGHAWFTVLYPKTGWVFCEPQHDINTLSIQHYLDRAPIEGGYPNSTYLSGVENGDPVYAYSVSSLDSFPTADGAWKPVIAATAHHAPSPAPTNVEVHLDLQSPTGWLSTSTPSYRAWVVGTPSLVWCRFYLDGRLIDEGPPPYMLRSHEVWLGDGFAEGIHPLRFEAEDGAGRIFTGTRSAGVDFVPPPTPTGFRASPGDHRVSLSWTNPPASAFDVVRVLRGQDRHPDADDPAADVMYEGRAASVVDSGTANGVRQYYSVFAVDNHGNRSSWNTASAVPAAATNLSLGSKSAKSIAYASAFSIEGTLTSDGEGLLGKRVILQSAAPGGSFRDSTRVATTTSGGAFAFSVRPTKKTYYRVRFAGVSGYAASGPTSSVYATPRAHVGTPIAPSAMSRGKSYAVYGYLKPRHTAGTYSVRIYRYRYVSGSWRSYGYVKAKASNYSDHTKYSVGVRLAYKGRWRLRAYSPADSGHAAAWSGGCDYTTAK